MEIATAQLCPCEGDVVSLDACLMDRKAGCAVSERVAILIMRMIKEEKSDEEIETGIAKEIEKYKKVNEFDLTECPYKGNPEAPVIIVEFADFKCKHFDYVVSMWIAEAVPVQGQDFEQALRQLRDGVELRMPSH